MMCKACPDHVQVTDKEQKSVKDMAQGLKLQVLKCLDTLLRLPRNRAELAALLRGVREADPDTCTAEEQPDLCTGAQLACMSKPREFWSTCYA